MFFFTSFFFFNDTATTEIYTLSLHDALPISCMLGPPTCRHSRCAQERALPSRWSRQVFYPTFFRTPRRWGKTLDRKSTRLNSSHTVISYAVFCLKKKKKDNR